MKKLENKIALVCGGAGGVGEGIVKVLLSEGAKIVVPSRSEEKLQNLVKSVGELGKGNLFTICAEVGKVCGAEKVRDFILKEFGKIDLVVASLGGWWQGTEIFNAKMEDFNSVIENNLASHFVAVRTFFPVLLENGSGTYVMINGGSSEHVFNGSSLISLAASAQLMIAKAVASENKNQNVKIYSVPLYSFIVTGGVKNPLTEWLTAEQVGTYVVKLATQEVKNPNEIVHKLFTEKDI
ncbi:SDR family NAD(P)-dependent oxidoreductase [bacterium]|nr:SDR family NAD(P)-dependent oxidoreductase [bacterium]